MADLQKPSPAKRALPFKRTARQRPPADAPATEDDGLALFSQSKTYFPTVVEDQQKRAREKAEKAEQERKEKLAREREEAERKAREARQRREWSRKELEEEELELGRESERQSAKKRRRPSLLASDGKKAHDDKDDDDDVFSDRPSKSRKSSDLASPGSGGGKTPASRSSRSSGSARATRSSKQSQASVVLLDSSDEEDSKQRSPKAIGTSQKTRSAGSGSKATNTDLGKKAAQVVDSDSDLEMWEDKKQDDKDEKKEDDFEYYIKLAEERKRKKDTAQSATPGADGDDDERGVPVTIMIVAPTLENSKPLCCKVRTAQPLQIAFDTFKERLKQQDACPRKVVSELVFTWRGDRVYHTTKLETLGIRPRGSDGRLHDNSHSGRSGGADGYVGADKVYFEAWTPEEYKENQEKRERERERRELGEWWNDDDNAGVGNGDNSNNNNNGGQSGAAAEEEAVADDRVKVIFKARDMPARNVTLRKYSTVAHMIKAFRKLAGLPEDKHVEIRWDGEVLDHETTVEDADIGDMDSVEVHIR
ncbi:hypothetical protein F4777DRAFT_509253 [Nemania sp. FL0916]|nr:hypothetical protein F4777DRAFT_509253 [Nemania sp. FL0916]